LLIAGQNEVGAGVGSVMSLDDEQRGPNVEIFVRPVERPRQLETCALELVVRKRHRDIEQTRRADKPSVVTLQLDEPEAPVLLPVALQALEDVESADDCLRGDVENRLLPGSHLAVEEDPVGLL
jgi:hypothetical protein